PMMFVEIKPGWHRHNDGYRLAADTQMCECYWILKDMTDIPRLYGLSALGTGITLYKFNRKTGQFTPPLCRVDPDNDMEPVILGNRYNLDVLSKAGEWELHKIIKDVKQMCAARSL
ncbi:hypothetical protein K439DRAFT_1364059, partial [Ramaria rubella]